MAARKNRGATTLPDAWKEKIKATMILRRLVDHVEGKIKLEQTQVSAANILLKKVIPDLSRAEVTGKDGGAITTQSTTLTDQQIIDLYNKRKGKP